MVLRYNTKMYTLWNGIKIHNLYEDINVYLYRIQSYKHQLLDWLYVRCFRCFSSCYWSVFCTVFIKHTTKPTTNQNKPPLRIISPSHYMYNHNNTKSLYHDTILQRQSITTALNHFTNTITSHHHRKTPDDNCFPIAPHKQRHTLRA